MPDREKEHMQIGENPGIKKYIQGFQRKIVKSAEMYQCVDSIM